MTVAREDAGVLRDVVALPPEEALRRLSARGDPGALILAGAEEAERLIITDLARALEASEALVCVADSAAALAARARVRRARAQALAYANRFDEALTALREAVSIAEQQGDALEAARARMTTLHALARLGRYDEGIEAGESARRAFVEAGEPLLAARADINLGVTRRMADDPARAIEHFERSRPALTDEPMLAAQMESNRAEALLDLNRFDEAWGAFTEALAAFRRAGAGWAAGIVEGNLADLAARHGRLDDALEHFERARRLLGEDEAGDVARLQAEQAETLAALGLFKEAVEQFRAVLPALDELKLALEAARARASLGACLLRSGRASEASGELALAASAFESLGHVTGAARIRLLQSELARQAGDHASGERLLSGVVDQFATRPALASLARLHLAQVYLSSGRADRAMAEIETGLAEARRLGLSPLVADFLHSRAEALWGTGARDRAIADLNEAIGEVERVRGTLRAERFRAAFLGDRARLYERCVGWTLDAGGAGAAGRAYEIAERARSRSLLDALEVGRETDGAEDAPDDDERALLLHMSRLRAEMNALYAALDDGLARPRATVDLRWWNAEVTRREREMTQVEGRLSATARYAPVFSGPRSLGDHRGMLGPSEALLHFCGDGPRMSAFIVRPGGVTVRRGLARPEDVTERAAALYFQIGRAVARGLPGGSAGERLCADTDRELRALYDLLVGPLEDDLSGADRLVVVPHGVIHSVPIGALRADRRLLERLEVLFAPSAGILARLRERPAPQGPRPGVIVGVSDALAPHADNEAAELGARMPTAATLVGAAATTSAFREAARGAGMIHVAAHARFSPGDPLNSGLKLADGWLTAREIAGLRLDAPVVVLSGCDTGKSAITAGDEIWGLVRSFLVAGASTLIISLWPAHDRSTAELMLRFHSIWQGGNHGSLGPAASLRESQMQAARLGLHPAVWANFVVIGR